jgi:hypothetical protein
MLTEAPVLKEGIPKKHPPTLRAETSRLNRPISIAINVKT